MKIEGAPEWFTPSAADGDSRSIVCVLCPNGCRIEEGRFGTCGVRYNNRGAMTLPCFGAISSMGMDPIEKKPLYHFLPGTLTFSAGFFGCTLDCPFCQNHRISKSFTIDECRSSVHLTPTELVDRALAQGAPSLAFTYSEPMLHFEYVKKAAGIAREKGLRTVLVTNGYLNPGPAGELLPLIDAANIDLKSGSRHFYAAVLKGGLAPVRYFIEQSVQLSVHTEITTLLIPEMNDSIEEIEESARFLARLDPDIPWHISAYHPAYRFTVPATKTETVLEAVRTASAHLNFVYPGNIGVSSRTVCPDCGAVLVERNGYSTISRLSDNGSCPVCGRTIAKIFPQSR